MPTYTGSGTVNINGCTTFYFIPKVYYKYRPGDIVYYKPKAQHGKLEKIVIEKVNVIRDSRTEGGYVFMYVDTFHSIYNQFDLIWESEALELIKFYIEKQILLYKAAIRRCRQW